MKNKMIMIRSLRLPPETAAGFIKITMPPMNDGHISLRTSEDQDLIMEWRRHLQASEFSGSLR